MGRRHEQTFLQRRHTDGQQTHKKMLNITHHQGMQIKTSMRNHLTPVRMAKTKKTNVGEDVEKGEPSDAVGGNANWCSHSGKQCGGSSKS